MRSIIKRSLIIILLETKIIHLIEKKILEDLLKEKIVKEKTYEKIKVRYFDVWSLTKYLNRRIKQDNYYLVNKN